MGRNGIFLVLVALALGPLVSCSGGDNGSRSATTAPPRPGDPGPASVAADGVPGGEAGQASEADRASEAGEQISGESSAVQGSPGVALASEPDIDLVDNRFLWHLAARAADGGTTGLLLPVAAEGFRKYTQEYRRPWGEVVAVDGESGRALGARTATLRIPWTQDGAATVRLRAHGAVNGQRLTLRVNGKTVANASLEARWQTVDLPVADGILRPGENEIALFLGKRGGPARSYGLFHSIAVAPDSAPLAAAGEPASWPVLSPAAAVSMAGQSKKSLTGFGAMTLHVEVPATGWLELATGSAVAPARFRATVRTPGGVAKTVLDHRAEPGAWTPHQISLAEFAGRLSELTLTIDSARDPGGHGTAGAAWGTPRIALEAASSRQRPAPYRNAIILVIDALRSDRLALYGETRVQTPNMTADGRARGVTFLHNQAASPSSPPSHGSIQTGMIPRVHGVTGDQGQLKSGTPMISTQLGDVGVATGYFGNNPFGMARLERPGRWTAFHQPNREGKGIDCTVLMDEMLGFAEAQSTAGERFFISSLPYETHTPYRYHEGITDRYHDGPWGPPVGKSVGGGLLSSLSAGTVTLGDAQWSQLKALYDGEAEYMDGCYKQLLDGVTRLGLRENTLIVITSDHGEGMFEHGRMGHAFGHYAELGNVPLVLVGDGLTGQGVALSTVTSHLDIVPTVLDLMGVAASERVQGRSLVPLAMRDGPWTPRVMPLEYGRSYSLRAEKWRYIVDYQGNESLFDVEKDPTEQNELGDTQPMALRYLRDLAGFFLVHRSDWRMTTWGPLNNHDAGFLRHVGADTFASAPRQ